MTDLVLQRVAGLHRLAWLRSVWALIGAICLSVALTDPSRFWQVMTIAAEALIGTLPYIAVAVLMIAWLKASGAEGAISKAFEGRQQQAIVMAALIGGLAPFCSCEVVPFIAGLLAAGAPLSAVMAFWLASPLIDPPTLVITAGALGWEFAIGKTISAVSIGLLGGYATWAMVRGGLFVNPLRPELAGGAPGCGSSCGSSSSKLAKPVWRFWQERNRQATFVEQSRHSAFFLLKWLTFAYLLEALMITYIPADAIATVVGGPGIMPIVLGALVGAPAYLNGYAAPPLIAGLMEQGMSAGAAMSFMVAGAVSSIPAMAAVFSLVRKPVFAAYVGFGFVGAVLSGMVFAAVV
ncbi:MAG: permease [Pseudomonadota bacterium]